MSRSLPVSVTVSMIELQFVAGQCQRLLDEDGLSGLQGTADEIRVGVMACHDEDRIQRRVVEHRVSVGGRGGEPEPPLRVHRGQRPVGGHVRQS